MASVFPFLSFGRENVCLFYSLRGFTTKSFTSVVEKKVEIGFFRNFGTVKNLTTPTDVTNAFPVEKNMGL